MYFFNFLWFSLLICLIFVLYFFFCLFVIVLLIVLSLVIRKARLTCTFVYGNSLIYNNLFKIINISLYLKMSLIIINIFSILYKKKVENTGTCIIYIYVFSHINICVLYTYVSVYIYLFYIYHSVSNNPFNICHLISSLFFKILIIKESKMVI